MPAAPAALPEPPWPAESTEPVELTEPAGLAVPTQPAEPAKPAEPAGPAVPAVSQGHAVIAQPTVSVTQGMLLDCMLSALALFSCLYLCHLSCLDSSC